MERASKLFRQETCPRVTPPVADVLFLLGLRCCVRRCRFGADTIDPMRQTLAHGCCKKPVVRVLLDPDRRLISKESIRKLQCPPPLWRQRIGVKKTKPFASWSFERIISFVRSSFVNAAQKDQLDGLNTTTQTIRHFTKVLRNEWLKQHTTHVVTEPYHRHSFRRLLVTIEPWRLFWK